MLKALELAGFKSFADRTRFEFPDGITVVVGPNGSGKSNIVDAIKWVLGAQSAKSLRGADMADVIFKGSAVGGRKAANSAEATLVFDNSDQRLPHEAPEVHVTRRVYRSGESEYLINGQPCRLKDIKDLFRGTGVGVDAYSLIEQGKVDRMLQASPKDRRAIFEEAAGISRFKAKKVEAERRLARVDQNLLRLRDIVDEVKGRFDSLQNQATKARKYREMQQRLTTLRTQLGLDERTTLEQKQIALEQTRQQLENQSGELQTEVSTTAETLRNVETLCQQLQERLHTAQQSQSDLKAHIAALESTQVALRERVTESEQERGLCESRLASLRERAVLTGDEVERLQQEQKDLEASHRELSSTLEGLQSEQLELDRRRQAAQGQVDRQRAVYLLSMKQASEWSSQATANQQLLTQLQSSIDAKLQQLTHLESAIEVVEQECNEAKVRAQHCETLTHERQAEWSESQKGLEALRKQRHDQQDELVQLQSNLHAIRERLRVLEELEQQLAGVGQGAKRLIELSQTQPVTPWNTVRGLVADLIEIDVHLAPLIDVALDSAAETVVLTDGQIIQNLREGHLKIEGRVSLIRLDRLASRRTNDKVQLDGLRGVIGRADRLVRCSEEFQPLVRSLLGNTWLVDSLATALDLSHLRGAGLRFVTAACERIEADGTLTLGALKSALGLVARRSELQAAREEILFHQNAVEQSQREVLRLKNVIQEQAQHTQQLDQQARESQLEWTNLLAFIQGREQQLDSLRDEQSRAMEQLEELRVQCATVSGDLESAKRESLAAEGVATGLLATIAAEELELQATEGDLRAHVDRITSQRVLLAKNEQRLESHRTTLLQWTRDHAERHQAVEDAHRQIQMIEEKLAQAAVQSEKASQDLQETQANLVLANEAVARIAGENTQLQADRILANKRNEQATRQFEKLRDRLESLKAEWTAGQGAIEQLLQHFRDEYQIDLQDPQVQEQTPPLADKAEAESEMTRLRQDIVQVGAVNMEALKELDALQTRYEYLAGQQQDLIDARDGLQRIIAKINQDSRRLFLETLEAIRANFQVLYRKSFGGGTADIILEEGVDVLECGVEVIATPPGKTSLSNSLLSGGEKALTAVALIMAIFQFRPSPFCVLDEVDAPFDEANIGRFVSVLKEFLDWTKFIVVTHSKKTMTAANTLYGVTMQESGVSTQVSVRFEDVDEEGHILKKAA